MREAAFVKQNKEKWIAFEKTIQANSNIDPNELAEGYIQLTNDLSYAQTYYPDSKTLFYLNSLASTAHQIIYKNKKERSNRLIGFWKKEFPLFFKQYHRTLLFTFIVFALSTFIGAISVLNDDSFIRLILGDDYVNQTITNIQNGNPTAIYKSRSKVEMFLGITINNIRVSFYAFVLGVLGGFGTIWVLFNNGIMLGAFVTFFYTQNVFFEANKQVWLHGTIEISVIIIAGCAGIVMGNGILFPKTYSRRLSFMKAAKDGLKIVVSAIPFFIIAGFIEGFITRYSTMPNWLAITIIAGSLGLVIFYYILYPIYLNRQNGKQQTS